ncbi:acyl-homoserine-lactone synthase, partial [Agrobacterium sp. NPDC089420]|uniref:acyl-homoserine-lactone synthase n=1 Tax=Agrobacterium sp. NPDC089420 TaxID=3363918 RepID=UPI00384D52A4
HGESSKASLGASCPSDEENGRMSFDQRGGVLEIGYYGEQFRPKPDYSHGNVWECSRFCVHSPETFGVKVGAVSSALLEGLCEHALSMGIDAIVGFFDKPMRRIYSRIGWVPEIIASSSLQPDSVVGRWNVTQRALEEIRERAIARSGIR